MFRFQVLCMYGPVTRIRMPTLHRSTSLMMSNNKSKNVKMIAI